MYRMLTALVLIAGCGGSSNGPTPSATQDTPTAQTPKKAAVTYTVTLKYRYHFPAMTEYDCALVGQMDSTSFTQLQTDYGQCVISQTDSTDYVVNCITGAVWVVPYQYLPPNNGNFTDYNQCGWEAPYLVQKIGL